MGGLESRKQLGSVLDHFRVGCQELGLAVGRLVRGLVEGPPLDVEAFFLGLVKGAVRREPFGRISASGQKTPEVGIRSARLGRDHVRDLGRDHYPSLEVGIMIRAVRSGS